MTPIGLCPDCKREWSAHGEAHCIECHEQFGSDFAFTRHRTTDFECIPVEDFSKLWRKTGKPMLVQVKRASGPVWVSAARTATSLPDEAQQEMGEA